jgi:hypothetical protein
MMPSVRSFAVSACALLLVLVAVPTTADADVISVTLNPATITGGTGGSSIGTVAIAQPAPAGGRPINLTSSNTDLAASTQRLVVPEGATAASFTVGTNALYRPYSGLAFDATITASDAGDGSSASAVLHVTAQPIPGPVTGGDVSTDGKANFGRMCGGSAFTGQASERGILFDCQFPQPGGFSVCRFVQECTLGCETRTPNGRNRQDACSTAPPFPVAVNPELLEGGSRSIGAVFIPAPANSLTSGNVNVSPGGEIAPGGVFSIPQGTTTAPFDVETFEGAVPAFLQVRADLSLNPFERFAQDYLAVVPAPGTAPPSGPLAVFSVDATPIVSVQGNPSIGTVILNGVAPSGGAVVSLSTDNAAADVPATVTVDAGQTATVFGVSTFAVSQPTPVTITASFGGVSRSTRVTVSSFAFSTTTPALMDLSVSPATVTAGTRSIGRVRLASPAPDPSNGPVTIALTSSNEAAVVVARHVTVGFGGTFADFRIRTFAVTQSTLVTLTATFNGVTRSATLTVNPSGAAPPPPPPPPPAPVTLSALSLNPASVVGGNSSAGTVTLSAAAPAGGAAVSLSDNSTAASTPASVTVPAGATSASFTVTTSAVSTSTPVTISAAFGGVTRTAVLNVTPASQLVTLTVTATGRSGERVTSSPSGINVAVGSTGSASFAAGTILTLSATNGRDVVWSGACSTGGNKTKTCTFTLNGNASVSANVQ